MTWDSFWGSLRGKSITLLGFGVSHRPLLRPLLEAGATVTVCDKKPAAALWRDGAFGALCPPTDAASDVTADTAPVIPGVTFCCGEDYPETLHGDLIFRSPGLHPDRPELARARAQGIPITSEMDSFFQLCPCPIYAVTGSDGKTTTTSLIAALLQKAGHRVFLGGNIGHPLLCDIPQMGPTDRAVVELSSFQLMDMTHSPRVAVLTNVTPNHLDIHRDMDEYVQAKAAIFRYQQASDDFIFNAGCPVACKLSQDARSRKSAFGWTRDICRASGMASCFTVQNDCIVRCDAETPPEVIVPLAEIRIPGRHNVENMMAAFAAVRDEVSSSDMAAVARDFPGVPHRLERLPDVDGVHFVNDSIASTPTRTLAGLRSFADKVILIAGGYDKKVPFDLLGEVAAEHVKLLLLIGVTAPLIRRAVEAHPNPPRILDAGTLDVALQLALEEAEPGDTVLLSPACASFDQYPNFAARGEHFRSLVREAASQHAE